MTSNVSYVRAVPGDNARADAVNLILAAVNGQDRMAELIVNRQPNGDLENLLGTVTALAVIVLGGIEPGMRDHVLTHFASIAARECAPAPSGPARNPVPA